VYLDVRFPTESLTANSAAYVRGGFHIGAVKTFKKAIMTDGTVAYLNANQENAYAAPHGNYTVVDIANDSYANAWLRVSGVSHFGVVPTYGYAFNSKAADYATSNTGVYYCVEAGLIAEVSIQYHHTYGVNCYNGAKLYWSTDEQNWTQLTDVIISAPYAVSSNHRTVTYTVELPSAQKAGAEAIYLDVRFPTENLTANTTRYGEGGFHIGAVRTKAPAELPIMTEGDIAYINIDKENAFAEPHGDFSVVNTHDKDHADAWIRQTNTEYFGIVPSYAYAFNTQSESFYTNNTGVTYRVEAGLTAEFSVQYHAQYGTESYTGFKLYWSTDKENWTMFTSYEISEPEVTDAGTYVAYYTVPMPSAEKAGADNVYFDIRFPTENLYLNGTGTASYAKGGLHIGAVYVRESASDSQEVETMTDGTMAVLDLPSKGQYSLAHGAAIAYCELLTNSPAVDPYWVRTPKIAYFGSYYAPSYGYAANAQAAGYTQQINGVYYKMEAGLYATVAIQYHNSYSAPINNFTFYATTDINGDSFTKLTAETTGIRYVSDSTGVIYYIVKLPDAAECGSEEIFLDVRFPTENLGEELSAYKKGAVHIAAVKTTAQKPTESDIHILNAVDELTTGTLMSFENPASASAWMTENASLTVQNNALKATVQSAGDFAISTQNGSIAIPYGASYSYIVLNMKASGFANGLTVRLSNLAGTEWAEYDIAAEELGDTLNTISLLYRGYDRSSSVVNYAKLTKIEIKAQASEGAYVELSSVERHDMMVIAENAIALIEDVTAENYEAQAEKIADARALCQKLIDYRICTKVTLYQMVENYIHLVVSEEKYAKYSENVKNNISIDFGMSGTEFNIGDTMTGVVTATALNGTTLPELTVKFNHSFFVVDPNGALEYTIAKGSASVEKSLSFTAKEGGISMMNAKVYAGEELVYEETIRVTVLGKGWYMGDSHSHSTQSDGKRTLTENFLSAYNKGLGFMITADHNALVADKSDVNQALSNLEASGLDNFFALKMSELTGNHGHMLQYASDLSFSWGTSVESWQAIMDTIAADGGYSFMAHPFDPLYPFEGVNYDPTNVDIYNTNLTGIEVINTGGEYIKNNYGSKLNQTVTRGLEYLDRLNIKGEKKYFGIANSDAHMPVGIGTGRSVFLLDDMSEESIYYALANGRFYGTIGPQLRFTIGDAQLGETYIGVEGSKAVANIVAADEESYVTKVTLVSCYINAEDNDAGYNTLERVVLYEDDGTLKQSVVNLSYEIDVENNKFYRIEVEGATQEHVRFAYSNPIWTETKEAEPEDLNGDGEMNVCDLILLRNMLLDIETENSKADFNGDEIIDIFDLLYLKRVIMFK